MRVALAVRSPDDAVTVAVPMPTERMRPGPLTVATVDGVTDHVTTFVTLAVLPSLNVPVAE
jgi:hypothetical protein